MGGCIGSRVWVVRLSDRLVAVGSCGRCATCIRTGGWIIGIPSPRDPIWTVGGRTGAIVSTVPCAVSVVAGAVVDHGSAVPVAVPIAVAPAIVDRGAHCDTNSECNHGG